MEFHSGFNWTILLVSFAVLIYLGYLSSRVVQDDQSGFLVAGRSLGPFVGAGTIAATGFSGWGFMGSPGVAYQFGAIEILGNFMFAPAMVLAVLYFADFMRKRAERLGSFTIPEYVAQLHADGPVARWLKGVAASITIVLLLVFLTSQIKAVGLLGASWLGIELDSSALLMISVIILYTMLGGLAAVAWTDTLMVVGMAGAALIMMVQIFTDVSLVELFEKLTSIDPQLANPISAQPYGESPGAVFLVLPYAFLFSAVLPYMAVRFLAIKPEVKMHRVAIWLAPLACLLSLVPIVGLYMRVQQPALAQADQTMPAYLATYLHPALGSLVTLFILFAMKSTANSLLHTVASAASHDLRTALFPDSNPSAKRLLWINRLWVLGLGVIGLLMMLYTPPFMLSWLGILGTGTLLAAMIGPVFISSFWRGNGYGAIAAMSSGFATSAGFLLMTDVGWVEGPLYGCAVSSCLYVLVSQLTFARMPRHGGGRGPAAKSGLIKPA
ncbi:sodium:solute symporter family protein [Marinobacterium arenosum]|uniref:sodium:solute symporter family protein n=1 Tax=Marinobacterium arenosum TaxID=2862496 RepID=UPI001C9713F0|nr:sodium:solute symporter family protein [Marinobacterium arenosum]MBY4678370.1 sodium:solute symporter family protein [Marinobacterium arenosum]